MFEDLDELARGLAENEISRRQAIRWAGYSVLGAALSSMGFAESAEALTLRFRRRCRRKGGTPLERGECHCGFKCGADTNRFVCENNPICACAKTTEDRAEGRGFCADFRGRCPAETCSSSSECPSGWKCLVNTCCPNPVCTRPCPPTTASGQQGATSRVSGLTRAGTRGS
jgi:hypothetical protein